MKAHVLTWVTAKTSNTSHFLFLKITSFLCFQVFHMIDIQTILHTSLRLLPNPANSNPDQWLWASLWCTFCIPTHLSHNCQILLVFFIREEHMIYNFLTWVAENAINIVYWDPSLLQHIPGWNSTMQHPPCTQFLIVDKP